MLDGHRLRIPRDIGERQRPGFQIDRITRGDPGVLGIEHAHPRQPHPAATDRLAVADGDRADHPSVADDGEIPRPENRHPPILRQAHRVQPDDVGVQRQVGVGHRVVLDGVGIDRNRPENLPVHHRIGVVPALALVAGGRDPGAKAHPNDAGFVVNRAGDAGACNRPVVVGGDVDGSAAQPCRQHLQARRPHRCSRHPEGHLIDRGAIQAGEQGLEDDRGGGGRHPGRQAGHAARIVDGAGQRCRSGDRVQVVIEATQAVEVGFAAEREVDAARDDVFGESRGQIDRQRAGREILAYRVRGSGCPVAHLDQGGFVDGHRRTGGDVLPMREQVAVHRHQAVIGGAGQADLRDRVTPDRNAHRGVGQELDDAGFVVHGTKIQALDVPEDAKSVVPDDLDRVPPAHQLQLGRGGREVFVGADQQVPLELYRAGDQPVEVDLDTDGAVAIAQWCVE